jgi:hypothetical protein
MPHTNLLDTERTIEEVSLRRNAYVISWEREKQW